MNYLEDIKHMSDDALNIELENIPLADFRLRLLDAEQDIRADERKRCLQRIRDRFNVHHETPCEIPSYPYVEVINAVMAGGE